MAEPAPPPAHALTGRTLGDFVVKELIGEGGFGAVYRAEQPLLGREAVIKILHARHRTSNVVLQRFLREAKLASKLDHPYAAHVYAFGAETDGLMWIAMELVRGTPLNKLLRTQGPITLERFAPLLDRICEVIHSAHEAGIVHRDIKPANVMVMARAGRMLPKLLDFGIAKLEGNETVARANASSRDEPELASGSGSTESGEHTEQLTPESVDEKLTAGGDERSADITQMGVAMGSPPYMAPEQWMDAASSDARTDLYALGVLAYESLVGKPPFQGEAAQMARMHARKPVPPLGRGLPVALDAVIAKAMAKRKVDRYADALAFSAAFREASGLAAESETLPKLEETLRQSVIADAPQPVAEAVAALDAARNAHQARGALFEVVHVCVRYLGVLALACRTRVGAGTASDSETVSEALRALRRRDLTEEEWLDLTRELVRPFTSKREAHPIPELVSLFFAPPQGEEPTREGRLAEPLLRLVAIQGKESPEHASTLDDQVRRTLDKLLPSLAAALRNLTFLSDYRLLVPRGEMAEGWMGARRAKRPALGLLGPSLPEGQPILADFEGRPLVSLWPLAQVAPPTPGAPDELFLFDGRGRRGARLVAMPLGFERQDEGVWDWFRQHLLGAAPEADEAGAVERAPYRGLSAFTSEDAGMFFGREKQVEAFLNRLRAQPLLAVVGPSGAGKSSFVQAGVVPGLGPDWNVVIVRPGSAPIAALGARLAHANLPIPDLRARLLADPDALGDHLRAFTGTKLPPILVVIDQFEELFTLCLDHDERTLYANALVRATRSADDRVRVVLTLRDDFLVRAEQLGPLRDRLGQGIQLLANPAPEDLLRIVVGPARRAGYEFDDRDLPARMVQAVADQPGALALLSFTAAQLWELRDRHFKQLARKAYDAMGGVGGALAKHAEETLAQMTADEQRLVREAFRHLVTAEGTRAVLTRAELGQVLGKSGSGDSVIEKLIAARLLVASEEDRVEVVHEALLSAWPRLVGWRRDDLEGARLRDQLRAAARQWDERSRPRGLLWRTEALAEYQLWRSRYPGTLTEVEDAFGNASVREANSARRRQRAILLAGFAALAAIVVILLVSNGKISKQRAEAHRLLVFSYEEQGRQAYVAGDAARALLYLSEAAHEGANDHALQFLLSRATTVVEAELGRFVHDDLIYSISLDPNGSWLATGSADKTARIWDAATGQALHVLTHPDAVVSVRFSADGSSLLTACADGVARVFDPSTGALRRSFSHPTALKFAAFSADGTRVLTTSSDRIPRLWNVATGELLRAFPQEPTSILVAELTHRNDRIFTTSLDGVRFYDIASGTPGLVIPRKVEPATPAQLSPDDALVATVGLGQSTISLWNATTGELVASLDDGVTVSKLAFSPDGRHLASGGWDGKARIWTIGSAARPDLIDAGDSTIQGVAWSPAGDRIGTLSANGAVSVWELGTSRKLLSYQLAQPAETNARLVFANDGATLFTMATANSVKHWRATDSRLLTSVRVGSGKTWFAQFSPDDSTFYTSGQDSVIRAFATLSGHLERVLDPHDTQLSTASLSHDGRFLVTAGESELTEWELASWKPVHDLTGHKGTVSYAEVSRDGRHILSAGEDMTARVWDATTGAEVLEVKTEGAVADASFSPDGKRFVTCTGKAAEARIFSTANGSLLQVLMGHAKPINTAVFDAPGTRLVTAGSDGLAIIWDATNGQILRTLAGHQGVVTSAMFSPDGVFVATTGQDGRVALWDGASGQLLEEMRHTGSVAYATFSHDGTKLLTVGDDDFANVWNLVAKPIDLTEIDRVRRCRIPLRIEHGTPVAAPLDCSKAGQ